MHALDGGPAPFLSRGDDSGTHVLEQRLWVDAGIDPGGGWYRETGQGMSATLQIAAVPWFERLGIAGLRDRPARLLVVDEGFAPLDEATRGVLVLDLRALLDELGIAALVVTHDRREAAALASRTAVLEAGLLRTRGRTEEVLADPRLSSVVGGARLLDDALSRRLAVRREAG